MSSMNRPYSRVPKNYNGTKLTTRSIAELSTDELSRIGKIYHQKGELILAAWPDIIGPAIAKMTQAISFTDGVLLVKIKNSTLHSLLSQNEKTRLVRLLREKFPQVEIKTIYFRIG